MQATLQSGVEQFTPGFQSGPMSFFFDEFPAAISVDAFCQMLGEAPAPRL